MVPRGSVCPACTSIRGGMASSSHVSLTTSIPNEIPWPELSVIGVHQGGHSSMWPQARIGRGDARGLAFQGTGRVADLHHLPAAERDSGLSTSLSSAAPGKHLDSPGPVLGGMGSVCALGGPPRAPDG